MTDETSAARPRLKRRIGFWLLTLYGVGVMVGAGVYVLIGEVAGAAGAWTPLAFLLAGAAASVTAASFAELSARLPESAGEAAYARAAFGRPRLSLAIGLAVAAVGIVSGAAVLQGGVGYLTGLVAAPSAALIIGLGLVLAALAIAGVAESLWAMAALTLLEVGGLLAVAAVGLLGPAEGAQASEGAALAPSGLAFGVFLAFFAFIGFEDMVNMAEETRDPRRTGPRAILTAFVIVVALYALVAFAAVRAVDPAALAASDRPLALVVERAAGGGDSLINAIAVAAALNGVLAQVVMASRVLFGLGRRHVALGLFHETHPRFGTPVRATVLAALLVMALALAAPLASLAGAATLILLVVFIVMNLALIQLKRQGPPPEGAPDVGAATPWAGLILSALVLAMGLALGAG